jgi:hypothetical protein
MAKTQYLATMLAILAVCVAAAEDAASQVPALGGPGPLITDRPDQTESSAVVGPGFVQLEVGWTYSRRDDGPSHLGSHAVPQIMARIGLVNRLEARVGFAGWQTVRVEEAMAVLDDRGVGDIEVGVKYQLHAGRGVTPSLALLAGASVPTGEEAFSSGRVDPSFRLSFAHELTRRVSLGYNVGTQWVTETDQSGLRDTRAETTYTLAFGVSLTERLGVFAESFGTLALDHRGSDTHSLDGGLTLLLTNSAQLDVSGGFGLNSAPDDWFVGLGFAVRLPR